MKLFKVDLTVYLHHLYTVIIIYILYIYIRHICTHLQTHIFKKILHLYTMQLYLNSFHTVTHLGSS